MALTAAASTAIRQLFEADLRESEELRLRRDLETYRAYLAGPCDESCVADGLDDYDGHRHWTRWYEANRGVVVTINSILADEYDRDFWAQARTTIDTAEEG